MTELSRRTGIDLGNMSKIENGKGAPALKSLFKIREVLGCTMRDFFEDGTEGEMRSEPPPEPSGNLDLEYQKIGQRIRGMSADRDISQTELAERLGIHMLSLQKIERGLEHPPLKRLFQLSEIFRCPVWDLFEAPTEENFDSVEGELQKIGRRIRAIHDGTNISRKELAERMGVDLDTLARIEDGRKETTLEDLYRIREILGCAMRDFFEERTERDLRVEEIVRAMRVMKKIERAETYTK